MEMICNSNKQTRTTEPALELSIGIHSKKIHLHVCLPSPEAGTFEFHINLHISYTILHAREIPWLDASTYQGVCCF